MGQDEEGRISGETATKVRDLVLGKAAGRGELIELLA
jgi:hypothetical protein